MNPDTQSCRPANAAVRLVGPALLVCVLLLVGAGRAQADAPIQLEIDYEDMVPLQVNTARVYNCESGLWVASGQPLSPEYAIIEKINGPADELTFTPSQTGTVAVRAVCFSPEMVVSTVRVNVEPVVLRPPAEGGMSGQTSAVRVDGCENGMLILSNDQGNPLPAPLLKAVKSRESEVSFTPSESGRVKAHLVCFEPLATTLTRFYVQAVPEYTTIEIRWYPAQCWWEPSITIWGGGSFQVEGPEWHTLFTCYAVYRSRVPMGRELELIFSRWNYLDRVYLVGPLTEVGTYRYDVESFWVDSFQGYGFYVEKKGLKRNSLFSLTPAEAHSVHLPLLLR
jgi:hypothetical protein